MASGSCVPHQQAEHMTAPTKPRTTSMKTLANGEPSTHDPKRSLAPLLREFTEGFDIPHHREAKALLEALCE
jgi:hypothetical protein